jgi:hypothetical protein
MAPPERQRQSIPFGHNSTDFVHIQNNLVAVLTRIKGIKDLKVKILWVSCRLNRSKEEDSPVFVGWVEDIDAIDLRVRRDHLFAPIEIRFGDTHPSKLYSTCLKTPLGTVVSRNWGRPHKADATSQRVGEIFYGETHRKSAPIRVDNVYVGTLNAAFSGDPDGADGEIKTILIEWAQAGNSALVKYIEDNLDFSGPKCLRQHRN